MPRLSGSIRRANQRAVVSVSERPRRRPSLLLPEFVRNGLRLALLGSGATVIAACGAASTVRFTPAPPVSALPRIGSLDVAQMKVTKADTIGAFDPRRFRSMYLTGPRREAAHKLLRSEVSLLRRKGWALKSST